MEKCYFVYQNLYRDLLDNIDKKKYCFLDSSNFAYIAYEDAISLNDTEGILKRKRKK